VTTRVAIALDAPLRGVRLLSRSAPGGGQPATVQWLVQLGEVRAQRDAESRALLATAQAVQRALQAVNATVVARLDEIASTVVDLGLAVAREIIGDALERGAVDPTAVVVHCLRDCVHGPEGADLVIHLHPDDLGPVMSRLAAMPELRDQVAAGRIVPDAALARGSVRAETTAGRLRYDPREVFERMADAVRSAAAGGAA
jgi:flagellar biosynthesis/type III secretory pathway protein FliH